MMFWGPVESNAVIFVVVRTGASESQVTVSVYPLRFQNPAASELLLPLSKGSQDTMGQLEYKAAV